MKRKELIAELARIARRNGKQLELTEGGNHTKAKIGTWAEPIPRHREIDERLAKNIIKRAKNEYTH